MRIVPLSDGRTLRFLRSELGRPESSVLGETALKVEKSLII
jgi:hypothetical protein